MWYCLLYSVLLLAPHNTGHTSYEENFLLLREFQEELWNPVQILLTSSGKKKKKWFMTTLVFEEAGAFES
jgi:hypothetical protein